MKRTLLNTLIISSVSLFSFYTSAEDLHKVYQLATTMDPVVQREAARRDAAAARIDQSRSALLPNVSLATGVGRTDSTSHSFDAANVVNATLTVRQSVFDWRNWQNLSRSEKFALQSQTSFNNEVQNLIVRVTQAYFDVLRASDNVTFVEAEVRSIERQLEQTKQRFAVGLTAITDVHEAQAQYDSAVARSINAGNALENAREFLREITGQYHTELATLNTDLFSTSSPSPAVVQDWIKQAQDNNLLLKSQRILLEIAQQDIELAQAGHYPTVSASASLGSKKSSGANRGDSSSIGLTLEVPIYSGGGIDAGVAVAQASYLEVAQTLELNHRSVLRQVRNSFNTVNAQISSIRALEQAVISAESALSATEAGFEVGTRTIVDVLLSTRNLFDARRNLSGARYDYILSTLQLRQASGSLTEQDLLGINNSLKK